MYFFLIIFIIAILSLNCISATELNETTNNNNFNLNNSDSINKNNFDYLNNNLSSYDYSSNYLDENNPNLENTDLSSYDYSSNYLDANNIANSINYPNMLNVNVRDSYDNYSETWVEEGIPALGANVSIYDSSNNLLFSGLTNDSGSISFPNLTSGNYNVKIQLDNYESFTQEITIDNTPITINHIFFPDILFLVSYTNHKEKIDNLMNLSKRVCYISTTNYDNTKEWLLEHANFIQLDMYIDNSLYSFDIDIIKDSPAYENYMIAYTFSTYSEALLNKLDIHFIGGNPTNNNYNSIENTYIGSYFQAEDIPENSVLKTNMINLLEYIKYLINPTKYSNPTLDPNRTPLLASEAGIYHPDYGTITIAPDQKTINSWILANPGYNNDGIGSLNWMSGEYSKWKNINFHPANMMKEFETWYKQNKNYDKSFVVIISYYSGGEVIDSLIRTYESNGRPSFNLYQSGTDPAISSLLLEVAQSSTIGISSVNSLYSWSLDYANNNAVENLTDLDIAILKAVYDISQKGYESELGPQMEWTYAVTIPSFEGVFNPVVISYMDDKGNSHVIQSGIDKLVKLTLGWANLKDKNNSDKKITIVLYNYPPGKAEIGASYLDVFQSTFQLLIQLYNEGYNIGMTPETIGSLNQLTDLIVEFGNKGTWAQGLLNQYVEKYYDSLINNNQLISLEEFYNLISDINPDLIKELVDYWGDGIGEIMVYNKSYIVIPGMQFGNVFITFQPSRGWEEVSNYHDTTLPPHQQYVAFYEWLDKIYKTDAIVYMGTHGTLEFLPGHQIGVQEGDWSFELNLDPSIYLYIVSNPGEAMVARDRIGSLMITHMTPAMVSSSLYGNYTLLSQAIDGYKNALKLNVTENVESYKKQIIDLAVNLGYLQESDQNFDDWIVELHNNLDELENDFNTLGLHTIGKILSGEELVEETNTIVSSKTNIYNNVMVFLYPELSGLNYYEDLRGDDDYIVQTESIKLFIYSLIESLVNGSILNDLAIKYGFINNSDVYNDVEYIIKIISDLRSGNEWGALITSLNGGYVEAGLFADPAYADSIPTGYNGYASDTTKMPSKASYQSAIKIVDMLLANYYEEHGQWPELVGLILWGTEILRTEGIGISEFLYLLGCQPIWGETGSVVGVSLIPLKDLKVTLSNGTIVNRPRIDAYASMVTSNKDWITWMVTATHLANSSDESISDNFVKKHYSENPSLDRLFGLPGNVLEGTGMSTIIPNTADWDSDTVNEFLSDVYMNKVSYSWGLDENGNIVIKQNKQDFSYLLSITDLITQNFDSTWRLLDSDDYYDWFGGLLNAVKQHGGNPDTAFVDIRNQNHYTLKNYENQLEFEIRSYLINPKFLNAWLSSDAGWNAFSSKVQNAFGVLVVADVSLNSNLGKQLASTIHSAQSSVSSTTSAAASQSAGAWMLYAAAEGYWEMTDKNGNVMDTQILKDILNGKEVSQSDFDKFMDSLDSELKQNLQDLSNDFIQNAVQYDVACCHHTCKNIQFQQLILRTSTLSSKDKKAYSDKFSQATLSDPIYEPKEDSTQTENINNQSSSNTNTDELSSIENSQNLYSNGTSQLRDSASSGGQTSAGNNPSTMNSNAKSPISSSNDDSSSSSSESLSDNSNTFSSTTTTPSNDNSQNSYELNKKSTSKNTSSESSTPGLFIVAIIILICLFVIGYKRNKL